MASYTSVKVKGAHHETAGRPNFEQTLRSPDGRGPAGSGSAKRPAARPGEAPKGALPAENRRAGASRAGSGRCARSARRNPTRCWLLLAQCTESYHSAKISGDGFPAPPTKRREFLRFLAASPLAAALGSNAWAQQNSPAVYRAADALSVSDFEALTRGMLPPAHLGYLISGVDDDGTLKLNREGFPALPAPRTAAGGRFETGSADGGVRRSLGNAHFPLPGGRAEDVPRRGRSGGRARGQSQEGHADSVHGFVVIGGGSRPGARRPALVSALYARQLGRHREDGSPGGGGGMSGAGVDRRSAGRPQHGDGRAAASHRYPELPVLPHQRSRIAQRTADARRHRRRHQPGGCELGLWIGCENSPR